MQKERGYILVTGGAGYIGSHTNLELQKQGYQSVVFDNLSLGHREFVEQNNFIEGDLNNLEDIRTVFKKYNIKAVVHFAALSSVAQSVEEPQRYYRANVVNTLNLLDVMSEYGVKNFILSSTAAVYGEPKCVPIREESDVSPINPYGKSKAMIESILQDYERAYGIKSVSLRYFNACGADECGDIGEWHEPETHLIPLVLDVAIGAREAIHVFGSDYETADGTCVRDYIHVTDLAQAHILALEYLLDGNASNVFNLGNGKGYSVQEIIESVARVTQREIAQVQKPKRVGDPAILIADASKAREILGWEVGYTLDRIIGTAWKWHQKLYSHYKIVKR